MIIEVPDEIPVVKLARLALLLGYSIAYTDGTLKFVPEPLPPPRSKPQC